MPAPDETRVTAPVPSSLLLSAEERASRGLDTSSGSSKTASGTERLAVAGLAGARWQGQSGDFRVTATVAFGRASTRSRLRHGVEDVDGHFGASCEQLREQMIAVKIELGSSILASSAGDETPASVSHWP